MVLAFSYIQGNYDSTYISLKDSGAVLVNISEFCVNGLTGGTVVGVGVDGGMPSSCRSSGQPNTSLLLQYTLIESIIVTLLAS
jgi:hypothetical protein